MLDLAKIDLGNDEAEHDTRLKEYFVKTKYYENALSAKKTLIIGRKGSGKSAIFTLLQSALAKQGSQVVSLTPDQYAWKALKAYQEQGILEEQAHTNAWRLTLLSAVLSELNTAGLVPEGGKLRALCLKLSDSLDLKDKNWFLKVIDKVKDIKIWHFGLGLKDAEPATPLRVIDEVVSALINEWPEKSIVRILIDRLDDSWDASTASRNLMIGILKAAHDLNLRFHGRLTVTVFLRADIYDNLIFDDQDKLRQVEETLLWTNEELRAVVTERVRVSLGLAVGVDVWNALFEPTKKYRSNASAEKYIIDRTFKRPRDMISFVRMALESAIKNEHEFIDPTDVQLAEEQRYSSAKYKDLLIEYHKQVPDMKDLLDRFSGSLHKLSTEDILSRITAWIEQYGVSELPHVCRALRSDSIMAVQRVKRWHDGSSRASSKCRR